MEQIRDRDGLDHYGEIITAMAGKWSSGCAGDRCTADPPERWTRFVTVGRADPCSRPWSSYRLFIYPR